jgi:uncharacterized ParB-like nuclease family protein
MRPIKYIDIEKIKSKWHKNLITDWQPDKGYIEYLKKKITDNEYTAPIVVVQEGDFFYIVNGHHRYYAYLAAGKKKIKCILIEGTFEESEPLRKAEVLLKEFDQKTGYRYQFSGYLDRWAAAAEEHKFINKYRPTYKFRLYKFLKKILAGKS